MSHRLLVKDGVGEREMLLVDTLVVGRDPRCDISHADAQLSRRHAEFSLSDRGVVVRDLNSRNGMLVNGRKMLEALLRPGDVVQVGGLAVTFLRAVEPETISMSAPVLASPRGGVPRARPRRASGPQPVLPFRPEAEDDDRTRVMRPGEAARAAVAAVAALPDRDEEAAPWPPAAPPVAPPADLPLRAVTASAAAPAQLAEKARMPITRSADPGWTASLTWHVATLAILSFLVGAVSTLPWRNGPIGGAALTAAAVLFVPLVALLVSLGLGVWVAARVRRATLAAVSVLASEVRQAAGGEIDRVCDPLGTPSSADLAEAINDVLKRAGRP